MFYQGNSFGSRISARAHPNVSLKSPLVFSPLGFSYRIQLLRDLRLIHLAINIDDLNTYTIIRQRARIQHLVDILQVYAEDEHQRSCLRGLHVRFLAYGRHLRYDRPCANIHRNLVSRTQEGNRRLGRHLFTLEPLAKLQSLDGFEFRGCPEWFTKCLSLRKRGKGGPLERLRWPTKSVRLRGEGDFRNAETIEIQTRKCWQPIYDWRVFAVRNDVLIPEKDFECFPEV